MTDDGGFQGIFDEQTDELIGYSFQDVDGNVVAAGLDHRVFAYVDASDGEMYEAPAGAHVPEGFRPEFDTGDPDPDYLDYDELGDYDPRLAELEQRLADAEQQAAQPMQVEYFDPPADPDVMNDDLRQQADYLERALDRPLTLDERRRLAQESFLDIMAGEPRPDLLEAAGRLGDMGEGLLDVDAENRGVAHQNRVAFMEARLADQERQELAEQGLDDLADPEPPATADAFDTDDHSERVEYMTNRLRGADVSPDQLYSSSDILESEDWDDE